MLGNGLPQWLAVRWIAQGGGVTRLFSYLVAAHVWDSRLKNL
jgi:hypothetical protein